MPAQYVEGYPVNLEAAANDSLTWLEFFANKAQRGKCQITTENQMKLDIAIGMLRQFLPKEEPEFMEIKQEA